MLQKLLHSSERHFQVQAKVLPWASESLMLPLKYPPFGNAVPESLYKTAVLCMSKWSLVENGQRSSCGPQILSHPAADGSHWQSES